MSLSPATHLYVAYSLTTVLYLGIKGTLYKHVKGLLSLLLRHYLCAVKLSANVQLVTMSVFPCLPERNDEFNFFPNLFYAASGYSNMAAMADPTAMPSDDGLLSSINPMLERSDDDLSSSKSHTAGLQGYGAFHLGEDASSTAGLPPGSPFKMSPTLSISNYSISPNDLENSKTIKIAPQATGNDAAIDDSRRAMSNTEDRTTASKPCTRSSTGSTPKQRQMQQQAQAQAQTPKQKQQPAVSKTKKSTAKSKNDTRNGSGDGGRKSQPRNRSLERNCIAASKCRQKKKEWLTDLEANKSKLEKQFKSLHGEYNELMDEVTQLKNSLMTHAGCNDSNIDRWINNEANSYIRRLSQNVNPQAAVVAAHAKPGSGKFLIFYIVLPVIQQLTQLLQDTVSMASPESQFSVEVASAKNNGILNDYMFDDIFDADPIIGRPVSIS